MLETLPEAPLSRLHVGVGLVADGDPMVAVAEAAEMAQRSLGDTTPEMALVVTAGGGQCDAASAVRRVLGPVSIAGGSTAALLADPAPVVAGAVVICLTNSQSAAGGVAATSGRDLTDAAGRAARLVLAGWPFRARYPRGLGVAFTRPGLGGPAESFLAAWRQFMGPKLRTVCGAMSSATLYGASEGSPMVSVACLEAGYATGFGYAEGLAPGAVPDAPTLVRGSIDAAMTALKGLQGNPPRLVLVVEAAERHRALGKAAREEWAALRTEVGERTPCVGWLTEQVAAYGRGVRPVDTPGSLVVVALADAPRDGETLRDAD